MVVIDGALEAGELTDDELGAAAARVVCGVGPEFAVELGAWATAA